MWHLASTKVSIFGRKSSSAGWLSTRSLGHVSLAENSNSQTRHSAICRNFIWQFRHCANCATHFPKREKINWQLVRMDVIDVRCGALARVLRAINLQVPSTFSERQNGSADSLNLQRALALGTSIFPAKNLVSQLH